MIKVLSHRNERRRASVGLIAALLTTLLISCLALSACDEAGGGSSEGETSGPPYEIPATVLQSPFNAEGAKTGNGATIDISSVSQGYVAARCENPSRLKFQVTKGDMSYNYDLPNDGTPISCPINMENGPYTFRVMQNTTGNSYVELLAANVNVTLQSEFDPFLRPNVYCNYTPTSAVVTEAKNLAAGCANEGDVMRNIYNYIVDNIHYDTAKAKELADATGYVPNPDQTLASKEGICFDYSSLTAAMLRSLGIPCKIITGYVEPDDIYHAWNMVYLDGSWVATNIDLKANTWSLVDLTFAATGGSIREAGGGSGYRVRYTY